MSRSVFNKGKDVSFLKQPMFIKLQKLKKNSKGLKMIILMFMKL